MNKDVNTALAFLAFANGTILYIEKLPFHQFLEYTVSALPKA